MSTESEKTKLEIFKHGPLYESRRQIVEQISPFIQSGDLFFRLGNESFLGIPFSRLTARLTESEWSHASVAVIKHGEVILAEVNDRGTQECRFLDWIDFCTSGSFAVYRLKDGTPEELKRLEEETLRFLEEDPDYDFTFEEGDKFYCTESAMEIYHRAEIELVKPMPLKDLIPARAYWIARPINWVVGKLWKKKVPMNVPLYVVGNEQKGILSSDRLKFVLRHDEQKSEAPLSFGTGLS